MTNNLDKIARIIREYDDFLIASHISPDGDALGSMAAMGHILKVMGKRFSLFNESLVPDKFKWLNMPGPVHNSYQPGRYSWIILLDCGDFDRSGKELPLKAVEPIINIDHHRGNPGFGKINWIDISYSSVGEMVADLADHLDIKLNGALAEGIYLAVVSDTGFFSFGNTTPKVLELSSRLVKNGIQPEVINSRILNQWSIGKLHLHGMAMQQSRFLYNGSVGVVSITRKMLEETGTAPDDCEGLVNVIRNVESVRVAISLREDEPHKIKFSLRSTGDVNVQLMAAELNGGGHKNASGGTIYAPMDQARDLIVEVAARHLHILEQDLHNQ